MNKKCLHVRLHASASPGFLQGGHGGSEAQSKRRTLIAPDINLSLDRSEGSLLSDDILDTPDDLDINVEDMDTPDETDSLEFINSGNELEWEGLYEVIMKLTVLQLLADSN